MLSITPRPCCTPCRTNIVPAARYRLEIEPDNTRAEKLYKSAGFEELGYKQLVMDIGE